MSTVPHARKILPVGFADVSQFVTLTGDAEPMAITYGIDIASGPLTAEHLVAMRDAFVTSFGTMLPPYYATSGIRAVVGVDAGDPAIIEVNATTNGADTDIPHLPQNCALLVAKRTALGGRRNRGRFYVPGVLSEQMVTNLGNVDNTGGGVPQSLANDFLDALTTTAETNVAAMVILHSYAWIGETDPGIPAGFPAPTPVNALIVDGVIGTQRRRLRR